MGRIVAILNAIWNKVATVPLPATVDSASAKRINLTSQICLFILLQVTTYTLIHLINHRYYWVGINLANSSLYLLAYFSNRKGYHEFAKSLLIFHFSLTSFLACSMKGRDSGSYLYFLVVVCMIFTLFSLEQRRKVLLHLLIPGLGLLLLQLTDYKLLVSSFPLPENLKVSFNVALTITFFLIIFFMRYSHLLILEAEANRRESEARLNSILDSLNDVVWGIKLPDFTIEYVNKAVETVYGYTIEESRQEEYFDLQHVHPDDKIKLKQAFEQVGHSGEEETEYRIIRKDGAVRVVLNRFKLRSSPKGRPLRLEGIVRDITDFKRNENELQRKVFELDSFVYRSSHDMRAPLLSILGLINLLNEEPDQQQRQQFLQLIQKSVHKLDRFIIDMTDFSRNSQQTLQIAPINFEDLLNDCLQDLQYMEKAGRIDFKKSIICQNTFHSDVFRITSILKNLLSNAIKYQDELKDPPIVEIRVRCDETHAFLLIADNGRGIAREYVDRIFDMFFRASSESYGSGLGLYITKQMVEKLNGSINVESEIGKGTWFALTLPNMKRSAAAIREAKPALV